MQMSGGRCFFSIDIILLLIGVDIASWLVNLGSGFKLELRDFLMFEL